MQIQPLFMNFVATDDLPEIDNNTLNKWCLDQCTLEDTGRLLSNQGGYQSNDINLSDPILKPLLDAIELRTNHLYEYFQFDAEKFKCTITNLWININKAHNYNEVHTHQGFLSGCYYVEVPHDSGYIEFHTPIKSHSTTISQSIVKNQNEFNANTWKIQPIAGQLILFPAWLEHSVSPNNTTLTRISIAFNTTVIQKHK